MCVGRNQGFGWLIIFLLLFSSYAHSFLPLLARSAIGGVVGRVIASRAAAVAANDAVYLTVVSNTSRSLATSAASKASSIVSSGFFKTTSNVLTWGGIGYTMGTIGHDDLVPDGVSVDEQGNYFIKGNGGGSVIVVDKPSNDYPYYIMYGGKYYYGFSKKAVAQNVFSLMSSSGEIRCGFGWECTVTKILSVTEGGLGGININFEAIRKSDGSTISDIETFHVSVNGEYHGVIPEEGIEDEKDPVKVGQYISDKLSELKLDLDTLAKTINAVWMDAASKPDYQGVPFSSSNPVTVDEIKSVAPDVVNLKQQEWIKPAQVNANSPVEITVKGTSDIHVDLGDDPKVTAPDLAEPPTGETILKPIVNLLPFVKNMSIPVRDAQCPVWSFHVWDKDYHIDTHCILIEKIAPLLKTFSLLLWGILSLRIILTA